MRIFFSFVKAYVNRKRWLKNISIRQRLFLVMIIMALLIVFELTTLWFSVKALSAVRAFIAGEGLWSKAQKDAIYYLHRYAYTEDTADFLTFKEAMRVPLGDRNARLSLSRPDPDYNAAREGLREGRNHENDIESMIWLYTNFSDTKLIDTAMKIWGQGEPILLELIPLSEELDKEIRSPLRSQQRIRDLLTQVDEMNRQLTVHEENFSNTLSEGYRNLESLILTLIFIVTVTVELTGIALTVSVTMRISRGVNEIIRVSRAASAGNLDERATVFSNDEIGKLATSFNTMLNDLRRLITEQRSSESVLKNQNEMLEIFAGRLEENNRELERLAYVTSHHLREPLRAINSYSQLLESKYKEHLDKEGKEFMSYIQKAVGRMDKLTKDLVQYVQVSKERGGFAEVDLNSILKTVVSSLEVQINETKAKVNSPDLPVIIANKGQILQLFYNLIDNAIKFNRGIPPEITISCTESESHWHFSVADNGIGIRPEYKGKIFAIFQRLNGSVEPDGTGIGLTICKKVVEKHGGMIWVESKPNEGSVFYFTISKKPTSFIPSRRAD